MSVQKRHFQTFDALRFFAFLKVFLLHLPIIAFPWFNYLKAGGGIGVQFFFVLSGFLITYIILEEKRQTGRLNLKHFFIRRILRIWPLYYLMIVVAFITPYLLSNVLHLTSSAEGYNPEWGMSILFLENYKMMATGSHANVSPLSVMWSLCIEEHFYIVWGLLLYFCSLKKLPIVLMCALILGPVFRLIYVHHHMPTLDLFTNIDLFAWGAVPAYLLIAYPEKLDSFVSRISFSVKLIFCLLLLVIVPVCSQYADDDNAFILLASALGMLFSVLILFTLPVVNKIYISDRNLLSMAGVYTYGLYLYHTLVINLLKQVYTKIGWSLERADKAILFFIMALLLSLICSMLSYHLFEKQFLKLKKFFR